MPCKLVLFDIDGTLVLTGGAGLRAMNARIEEILGHRDGLNGIPVAGRTDWSILVGRRAAGSAARSTTSCSRGCAIGTSRILRSRSSTRARAPRRVMPGIRELLDALTRATTSLSDC